MQDYNKEVAWENTPAEEGEGRNKVRVAGDDAVELDHCAQSSGQAGKGCCGMRSCAHQTQKWTLTKHMDPSIEPILRFRISDSGDATISVDSTLLADQGSWYCGMRIS